MAFSWLARPGAPDPTNFKVAHLDQGGCGLKTPLFPQTCKNQKFRMQSSAAQLKVITRAEITALREVESMKNTH